MGTGQDQAHGVGFFPTPVPIPGAASVLEPIPGVLNPGDVGGLHYCTHRPRQVFFVLQRSSTSSHGGLARSGTKAF